MGQVDPLLFVDREFILAALKKNGLALKQAFDELKSDKEVVLAAVKESFLALKFASPELQQDRKLIQLR